MNRENIQEVRDHIAGLEPRQFDMGDFGFTNECGTVACIAGWTDVVVGGKDRPTGTSGYAQRLLDISDNQAFDLFYARDRSRDVEENRWEATSTQAVRVLDHLLETGEVDWSIIDAPSPSSDRGGS